ncbi:MAG: sugar-binding protein [Candidatus Omnitrophota bacterium]
MRRVYLSVLVFLTMFAICEVAKSAGSDQTLTAPPAPYKTVVKTDSVIKVEPAVREDGIFYGDKGLIVNKSGLLILMAGNKIGEFFIYFSTPYSPWITTNFKDFQEGKTERNLKDREFIYTAVFPLEKEGTENMPYGKYQQKVKVTKDNKISISYKYSVPEDLGKNIKDTCMFFCMPFGVAASKKFEVDGETFVISDKPGEVKNLFEGRAKTLVFNPGNPETEFSLEMTSDMLFRLEETPENISLRFGMLCKAEEEISFTLDLSKVLESSLVESKDFHSGVDFWKSDRLHVPDYSKSVNLAQNPSFEAGLRYYVLHTTWGCFKNRSKPVFSVDENVAKFGNGSLVINAFKGEGANKTGFLQTFAIPVSEGKKYTVSFYAKGNRTQLYLNLRSVTGAWPVFPDFAKEGSNISVNDQGERSTPTLGITEDWKRYVYTITAPNRVFTLLMGVSYYGDDPSGEGTVWVDGLQVEEGDKATDYVEKPLHGILLTSNPDNFLSVEDKKIDARLKITAPANTEGSVTCEIEDFFYQKIWKQKFNFSTDAKGIFVVSLPIENLLGKGVYIVRADFELSNGYKDTDFFRISRMEFLKNTHKNKDIFGSNIVTYISRANDVLKRCRDIGFGSANYGAYDLNKDYFDHIAEYGISFSGPVGTVSDGGHGSITIPGKVLIEGLYAVESVSPELGKKVEDACYEKAEAYPWVNTWCLSSESEGRYELIKQGKFRDFAKLLMACYRGVKRFDPEKKVQLEGGPCNMMPQGGTRLIDSYLTGVNGEVKFDAVCIHPYRTTPENPDLDDDAAAFFAVLDKHGYQNMPVYWNEGIFYTYYNIPAWGLDPHKGCSTDHHRAGCPSYHMGWGERISAAYFARSWLVALKYQYRVKQFNGWCSWMEMDAYLTPLALQKIPNTLGHLLGNAVFRKDIRFAPEIRCYVFEDEKQRPVAALWSHQPKVDRGYENSPVGRFKFDGVSMEIFDLMENKRSVRNDTSGFTDIPISPFPLFIRGGAGELASLCKSIQNGRIIDSDKAVIQISAKPLDSSELEVEFRNLVTREFRGKAAIKLPNEVIEKNIQVKGKSVETLIIPLREKIPSDRIAEINLPVTLTEEGGKPLAANLSFNAFAVKKLQGKIAVEGNAGDWKDIPAIRVKNRNISTTRDTDKLEKVGYEGDHEAEYQMAWDDEYLYLRVKVTDDKFFHNPNPKSGVGGRWDNDCLQVYIDTLDDARSKETRGFDGNDYNYDFFPNEDGTLTVFRRFAPEQQIAGGLFAPKPNMVEPEIKGTFRKTGKGYIYEIAFPKHLIAPVQLKAGSVSGFAIYIADHDGSYLKSALTTTSPGTGGYMNPHLYPVMILVER